MPLNGRILPITIKPGTKVVKGQVIAELEESDLQNKAAEATARIYAIHGQIKINQYNAIEKTALTESDEWIKTMKNLVQISEQKVNVESSSIMHSAMQIVESIFHLMPVYINEYINIKNLNPAVLERQLAEAKAVLAKIQLNLSRGKIKSPIDGIILNKYISNLRVLNSDTLLIELGNLEQLEATANILTEEAINIKPGNSVDILGQH